ncbi:hypothetical protein B7C42_00019 [Nocardia cerradoensis]|uniref:Uncharacterized protein n=1 Tax=Nocardia cerradoensis TaxID=85688 RepID=A0A231HDT2_9NOCA|nr:hypothetical protein B7C42_00019 [Nocardia cerradoensis]
MTQQRGVSQPEHDSGRRSENYRTRDPGDLAQPPNESHFRRLRRALTRGHRTITHIDHPMNEL